MSLIPGPSGTESRWAPTTTVRSARPVGVSAMTFSVVVGVILVVVATWTMTLSRLEQVVELLADGEAGADHGDGEEAGFPSVPLSVS